MKIFFKIKRLNNLTSLNLVKKYAQPNICQSIKYISTYNDEYARSLLKPEEYWDEKKNLIEWFKEPNQIIDRSNSPFEKWYPNGELNASYNCLDVNVKNGYGNQIALIHDSPLTGVIKRITYKELLDEVNK